ncbi:MAG: class I SAM-dependent methyltransferase [Candidatus Hermodarchaeia archaeon]|jgi:demethylmenaquinone methyltransferase/2-methoxy-6-polyprenyl-1,4-benzoquinol methylase
MTKGLQRIYSKIASVYERVNQILTFGLDGMWRRQAAKVAVQAGGGCWMDVCSGTGEMALTLQQYAPKSTIVASDFSVPMLRYARTKQNTELISFVLAYTQLLPFRPCVFDLVTIAFATRNLTLSPDLLARCLKEIHQSLMNQGRFVNIETSQPPSLVIRRMFHLYAKTIVKQIGRILFGSLGGAAFLANSIQRFYTAPEFTEKLYHSEFSKVGVLSMMFGAIAIHQGIK